MWYALDRNSIESSVKDIRNMQEDTALQCDKAKIWQPIWQIWQLQASGFSSSFFESLNFRKRNQLCGNEKKQCGSWLFLVDVWLVGSLVCWLYVWLDVCLVVCLLALMFGWYLFGRVFVCVSVWLVCWLYVCLFWLEVCLVVCVFVWLLFGCFSSTFGWFIGFFFYVCVCDVGVCLLDVVVCFFVVTLCLLFVFVKFLWTCPVFLVGFLCWLYLGCFVLCTFLGYIPSPWL